MRTLVVQAFFPWNARHADFTACMKTVEQWAIKKGYDYQCYRNPINTLDVLRQLDITADEFYNTQYYKFQWCDHPDYDRVCWIDADTVVWGDPDFLDDSWFCAGKRRLWYKGNIKTTGLLFKDSDWIRPTLSLFWGSGQAMHNLNSWFYTTLKNSDERGTILQAVLEKHPLVTEEVYLAEWVELNRSQVTWFDIVEYLPDVTLATDLTVLTQKQQFYYNSPQYYPTPNSLVHFPGANKNENMLRFLAYRLSLESPSFTVSNLLKKLQS